MQHTVTGLVHFFCFWKHTSAPGNWLVLTFSFPNLNHWLLHMKIYTYVEKNRSGIYRKCCQNKSLWASCSCFEKKGFLTYLCGGRRWWRSSIEGRNWCSYYKYMWRKGGSHHFTRHLLSCIVSCSNICMFPVIRNIWMSAFTLTLVLHHYILNQKTEC